MNIQENKSLNKLHLIDKFILTLYASYFILSPFYLWSSGLPQIADILLLMTMLLYLFKTRFKISLNFVSKKFILIVLIFLIWIIFTNLLWSFYLSTTEIFFRSILFYIYNFFVSVLSVSLAIRYKNFFLSIVYKAITISLILQFFLFIINGGYVGSRITGTFNNPNQLGYYSILVTCIIIIINNKLIIKGKYLIISLLISSILVLSSLSNAAIISWFVLYFFFLLSKSNNKKAKRKILLFTLLIFVVVSFLYSSTSLIQENSFYNAFENRLSQTQDKIGASSTVRGYNRITDYPKYWIFGAGEGAYNRFYGHGGEFHSTLGTVQVSYGIVGSILFIYFLWYALKKDKYKSLYIIFSVLLYGLSHNGLRNSMFWILLSIIVVLNNFNEEGSSSYE